MLKLNNIEGGGKTSGQKTDSNTTLVKVKYNSRQATATTCIIQIQHLLKLNNQVGDFQTFVNTIQIQHLLKLN